LTQPPGEGDAAIDVPVDVSGAIDAPAIDAPPLDAFVSPVWLTPTAIPGVNTAGDESDPCVSADQLTILFQRNSDLYIGTRATKTAVFTVVPLTALNSTSLEASPELTGNGTAIYFTSDRLIAGSSDVFRSVFSGGAWQAPTLETSLSDPAGDDTDIAISPDGLTAFVTRGSSFRRSTRPTTASAWSTPVSTGTAWGASPAAPSINMAGDVYLQAGSPRDLFVSRKAGNNYPTPTPITELNGALTRDAAPYIAADDLTMWFEIDQDLFETHR
jgi:hypothetical protein